MRATSGAPRLLSSRTLRHELHATDSVHLGRTGVRRVHEDPATERLRVFLAQRLHGRAGELAAHVGCDVNRIYAEWQGRQYLSHAVVECGLAMLPPAALGEALPRLLPALTPALGDALGLVARALQAAAIVEADGIVEESEAPEVTRPALAAIRLLTSLVATTEVVAGLCLVAEIER